MAPAAVQPGRVVPGAPGVPAPQVDQQGTLEGIGGLVEAFVQEQLGGGVATSTARIYNADWAKWCMWARRHEWVTPYLMGDTKKEKAEDESKLLAFAGYLAWIGASPSTVRRTLFAIQGAHTHAGAEDPLLGAPRL